MLKDEELKRRDYLLHVLTAREEVTYSQFKEVISRLYRFLPGGNDVSDTERPVAFIASQSLEALGHCNLDFEGGDSTIYTRRPSLDRLPTGGSPRAVLTGARSMETTSLLAAARKKIGPELVHLDSDPASSDLPFIPLRIEVQASDESILQEVASEIGLPYQSVPSALQVSGSLGTIEEYLDSLSEPRTGELENWPGRRTYHPEVFRFRQRERGQDKLRLVLYRHPHTGEKRYFLFRGDKRKEINREWGRYAVLRETPLRPLVYDSQKMLVAIPNGARLPGLQARALALCSGYAPEFFEASKVSISSRLQVPRPEQFGYHVYRWVDPRITRAVAESLDQTPLEAKLEVSKATGEGEQGT